MGLGRRSIFLSMFSTVTLLLFMVVWSGKAATEGQEYRVVLDMRFNEGTGDPKDSSGKDNHGVNHGAEWIKEGQEGSCLEFNGRNSYVEISDSESLNMGDSSFRVEAWIKTEQNSQSRIIGKGSEGLGGRRWRLYIKGGFVGFELDDDGPQEAVSIIASHSKINDNKWHHIRAVSENDGGGTGVDYLIIYIDGKAAAKPVTIGDYGNINDSSKPLRIGTSPNSLGDEVYFRGMIDSIKLEVKR